MRSPPPRRRNAPPVYCARLGYAFENFPDTSRCRAAARDRAHTVLRTTKRKSGHKVPPPLPHGLGSSAIVLPENLLLNVPDISPFFPPRFYVLIISHKSGIRPPVYKNFLKIFCHSPFSRKDVHFRPAETDLLDAPAVFQKSPPPVPKPFPFCDNNSDPCGNYFILPKPLPARGSHLISTYIYIL